MKLTSHLITASALAGLLALDPAVAHANHCGGTDTNDFSYMGTTCRYQRATGSWQYNHDLTITNDYDPYILIQRTSTINNCGSTGSTQVPIDATTTDTDTASYSVGVALSQTDKASIASDMVGALGISAQSVFTEGLQTSSSVSGQIGSVVTNTAPGCTKTTMQVTLIGFHNATVSGSVSKKHWYRIHCDNSQYTTSWNVCDTDTQTFTGSSATGCLSRAYLTGSNFDEGCAPEELSGECACQQGYQCNDAGVPDASEPDASYPDSGSSYPDAGVPDSGSGYPDGW